MSLHTIVQATDGQVQDLNHRIEAWQVYWTDYHARRNGPEDKAILDLSTSTRSLLM